MKVTQSLLVGRPVTLTTYKNLEGSGVQILAKEVVKTVGTTSGGVAITGAGWHAFQATHTVTQDQLLQELLKNGVMPDKANHFVGPLHEIIKSDPTRLLFVAFSGGGAGITVLEATRKLNVPWREWSQTKIITIGFISGALILSAIYLTLKYFGLMN